ncbi:MAG: DNA-directed RNA polymerase subunit alpha [Pelagibacteraceae bacterium]|mgnify:FL=1|nr:DNA-directed RNA polymerase subunit alpha [Pelagibacteraceae bacterium]MBT4646348.1 DNA-directed RNA polymerase subunit alpha [Pelagibacteraceae bacterium]MBT6198658.1 DNA-directed RNA polymerase subunit alpha [Pelagibacteraceae bacterium]MBT6353872.1 DNA-directed RNA polymerase subunit alpha [Pelagibacteraceae bacterium]
MLQKNWMELIKPSKMDVNVQENDGRTGVLVAEPLERGFGLTLGNAIRRVLLSSLQGAAITSVKIKGVVHEFSTIPGVKEDLTDILLNLKSVAVKVHSPGLKKMYIKATGPGEIRAGNFETDSETEIMNKDQLIMTLDSNADIEIEANIETGKGYVSAEIAEDENKIIGEIKLDAMFSPVVKATYKIENSRVGQVTDYDKLIFEVETNGVISPDDAIALASRILQDQLQAFINFDEPEIQQDQSTAEKLSFNSNLLKKVEELELSVRSANCLKNDNIIYIGDLVQKTESEMLRTPNFGRKSLNEIKEVLTQMELNLGMSVPDWPPENIDELAKKYEDPFNK